MICDWPQKIQVRIFISNDSMNGCTWFDIIKIYPLWFLCYCIWVKAYCFSNSKCKQFMKYPPEPERWTANLDQRYVEALPQPQKRPNFKYGLFQPYLPSHETCLSKNIQHLTSMCFKITKVPFLHSGLKLGKNFNK